jgi:hypothetical protein
MNLNGTQGSPYQGLTQTRPYDFGTDAIERQRVSLGQSLIDADFEYGIQATKWQTYSDIRKTPSFFEIPGSDMSIAPGASSVTSAGGSYAVITATTAISSVVATTLSVGYGGGSSITSAVLNLTSYTSVAVGQTVIIAGIIGLAVVSVVNGTTSITVTFPLQTVASILINTPITFYSTAVPNIGTVVSVSGLANSDNNANRAEGFFIVTGVTQTSPIKFTYTAKVGATTAGNLGTSYTVIRRGNVYNNGYARLPTGTVVFATTSAIITVTTSYAHGLPPATPISVFGWTGGTTVNGNYLIQSVPTPTTFTYATSGATIGTQTGGVIYVQPYSYTLHRPFDGGVILSPNIPTYGATVARQSKKVFRYQSGKGLLWSSGTLFCPNNDILSLTYSSGTITVTTAIPHGTPQAGATIQIRGVTSTGYNGTYTIATVVGDTVLTVNTTNTITDATAILGEQPRFIITNWQGASVRAGCFDDQNGLFWEYDGQTLWVVKRSCSFQLVGSVTMTAASGGTPVSSQVVTGTSTRFTAQLRVNDKITIRGMTYQVTSITNDTTMTVNPPYRGSADITLGVTACKIREVRVPQSLFNRDTIDGKGASGYVVDLTKMQMIGLQYTWYGAGFVDFMIRGSDGNWVYAHRIRNNNINDEAYMRTGNMPVRYEICNESTAAISTLSTNLDSSSTAPITLNDATTYWPPFGTVLVEQELISYTGKTATTLTGITRAATLSYNIADTAFAGASAFSGSAASAHNSGNTISLISCTCSPSLTHWGSALLMDGNFDSDRGYFFNYQVNLANGSAAILSAGGIINLFMLRLSPSVSNGIIGDIGTRDLLNRAQLLLQRLDVFGGSKTAAVGSTGSLVVSGILNPSGITATSWSAINSAANGSQPSFAQVTTSFSGYYIAGSGERIFSTISNNGQNSIDLSNLKEVCNGTIGGNQMFPDGPDTLLVQVSVPANFPNIDSYSVNLFWTEAQA